MKNSFYSPLKSLLIVAICAITMHSCKNDNAQKQAPATAAAETKPAASSGMKVSFEHFGDYDLATWEKVPVPKEENDGDVDVSSIAYKKDGITLTIDTLKSEYYFQVNHTVKDAGGKVQKMRMFEFTNDPKELIETVNDYTLKPAKKFVRKQAVTKPWQQVESVPVSSTGVWQESAADKL